MFKSSTSKVTDATSLFIITEKIKKKEFALYLYTDRYSMNRFFFFYLFTIHRFITRKKFD